MPFGGKLAGAKELCLSWGPDLQREGALLGRHMQVRCKVYGLRKGGRAATMRPFARLFWTLVAVKTTTRKTATTTITTDRR